MAEYKSGFKRHSDDRFMSFLLIGFAVAFFIIIISVIMFNLLSTELEYSSFDRIGDYSEITNMNEDEYLVYFYSEECYYCKEIKYDVLEFADENSAGIKVYFLDAGNVTGYNNIAGMDGTPSILMVVNGQLVDLVGGSTQILSVFDQINSGTYLYIN
ncbi:MAG: thioredoxin family protein [Candidatus Izimaplasma sp.]|nr:thioredoxin family protein [Candidatus Izimaplasma bacterium]